MLTAFRFWCECLSLCRWQMECDGWLARACVDLETKGLWVCMNNCGSTGRSCGFPEMLFLPLKLQDGGALGPAPVVPKSVCLANSQDG